jgi:hypothetical protein
MMDEKNHICLMSSATVFLRYLMFPLILAINFIILLIN